jgi:hypothetical protein
VSQTANTSTSDKFALMSTHRRGWSSLVAPKKFSTTIETRSIESLARLATKAGVSRAEYVQWLIDQDAQNIDIATGASARWIEAHPDAFENKENLLSAQVWGWVEPESRKVA